MTTTTAMAMATPAERVDRRARAARAAVIIGWSAFLAAAVATMVCFAFVDPQALVAGEPPGWWGTRMHVYTIGFFFFWFVGVAAAAISWSLARPLRGE